MHSCCPLVNSWTFVLIFVAMDSPHQQGQNECICSCLGQCHYVRVVHLWFEKCATLEFCLAAAGNQTHGFSFSQFLVLCPDFCCNGISTSKETECVYLVLFRPVSLCQVCTFVIWKMYPGILLNCSYHCTHGCPLVNSWPFVLIFVAMSSWHQTDQSKCI